MATNDDSKSNDGQKRSNALNKKSSDAKCAICLNIISNRSLTDTCFHEYCFQCINQWSLNHNRCPFCRQVYNNIIFNIVSEEVFEQIQVNRPIEEGIDDTLDRMLLLMAVRNHMTQRRDRVHHHLQLLNRRLQGSRVRNANQMREEIRELEAESQTIETQINNLAAIAREATPTQMALMDFINRNNILEDNQQNHIQDNDSIESLPSLESLDQNSGNVSDDEDSDESGNRNPRNCSRNTSESQRRGNSRNNKRKRNSRRPRSRSQSD